MSQVIVCDYCKNQAEKEKLIRILLKQGKKELYRYDVCELCCKKLLKRLSAPLVAYNVESLEQESRGSRRAKLSQMGSKEIVQAIEDGKIDPSEIIEEEPPESRSRQVRQSSGGPETVAAIDDKGNCIHANKSRVIFGKGIKVPYQICRDCNKKVPIQKLSEKGLDEPLPKGVRMQDET